MKVYREAVAAHGKAVRRLSNALADKAAFAKAMTTSQAANGVAEKVLGELREHRKEHG